MSDTELNLIPTEPFWMTDRVTAERAQSLLQNWLPEADEVTLTVGDEVQFVHGFENCGTTWCPSCKAVLDDWFWDQLGVTAEGGFATLDVATPCCGTKTTLNDLQFEWPMGFAKVVLNVRNPGRRLTEEEVQTLERTLGCKLLEVWAYI